MKEKRESEGEKNGQGERQSTRGLRSGVICVFGSEDNASLGPHGAAVFTRSEERWPGPRYLARPKLQTAQRAQLGPTAQTARPVFYPAGEKHRPGSHPPLTGACSPPP